MYRKQYNLINVSDISETKPFKYISDSLFLFLKEKEKRWRKRKRAAHC